MTATVTCPACSGHGEVLCSACKGECKAKCPKCKGTGRVTLAGAAGGKVAGSTAIGANVRSEQCLACRGLGFSDKPCPTCKGHGVLLCHLCDGAKRVSSSVAAAYKRRQRRKRYGCLFLFIIVALLIWQAHNNVERVPTQETQRSPQAPVRPSPPKPSPAPLPPPPALPKITIPSIDTSGMDEVFRKRLESYGRGLQEGKLDDVIFDAAWGIEERDTRRLGWSKYERQAKVFLELATAAKEGRSPNTSVADRDLPSPSVRPVPEPVQQPETPDWNARYEHWKQKYVSDFIPYAGNRSLTLKLNNGKSVVGTVRYIASDSIILDLKSGGAVKFQSDQISIDQRFQLFAPSYAEDKASRKVEIEKVHWAKHKKLLD